MSNLVKLLLPVLVAIVGAKAGRGAYNRRTVHEAERAIVLRFGRVIRRKPEGFPAWYQPLRRFRYWSAVEGCPPRYRARWRRQFKREHMGPVKEWAPGFIKSLPGIHQPIIMRVRGRVLRTDSRPVSLKGGLVYEVAITISYDISDPYRAHFGVDALEQAMENHTQAKVIEVLASTEAAEPVEEMVSRLTGKLQAGFAQWGVDDFRVEFPVFQPATDETRRLLLAPSFSATVRELMGEGDVGMTEAIAMSGGQVILNAGDSVPWPLEPSRGGFVETEEESEAIEQSENVVRLQPQPPS